MSTIEEKVLSMQFDNRQFQSGVSTTLNSLDSLKKGLDMSGSTKGLNDISDAAGKVNFNGMSSALDTVKVKFSAMQVAAVTALVNITNSALNAGKSLISSLTIDPIKDGLNEYETQMNAIQTILANTSGAGTSLDQVNAALQDLNTYSDKTIYNFTEMTRNIGTFTAAGVSLDKSTQAIKGIANLAAVSGSNSEQASTAMYQLSQAMAAGTVKLQDWNSVVNAGMGGKVFQDALMETARVHGVAIDSMVKSEGSFRETLQKGWLTSDILTETLSKFTGDLNADQLKTMGYTEDQIEGILKMGQTAQDAATKVKTITQLLDTLKEAVGSGWAQTWQILFGNFDEAKELFTNVSVALGGMISNSAQARNSMLQGWKDLGGRTVLIEGIKNAFDGVMGVVKAVGDAFRQIFPATTSAQLLGITQGFTNLTSYLKLSDTTLTNLSSTFKGAFAILDVGKQIFLAVANAIGIVLTGVGGLGTGILGVTGSFGEWLTAMDNVIKQSNIFSKVLTTIAYGIRNGFTGIGAVFEVIVRGIGTVITAIGSKLTFPGFEVFQTFLELMGKRMESIGTAADSMSSTVGSAFTTMGQSIANSKIGEIFMSIYNTVKMVAEAIGTMIGKMVNAIGDSLKNANFNSILNSIAAMSIGGMMLAFSKFMKSLSDPLTNATGALSKITGIFDSVRGSLESWQQDLKAGTLLKLAAAVGILSASIVSISLIDSGKLASSLAAIGALFAQLLVSMKVFSMIGKFQSGIIKANTVMISMSVAILILSEAMKNLASLDWNGVAKGTVGIAALATTLVATAKVLSSGSGAMIKGSTGMIGFSVAIKILASTCVELASLDWNGIFKGLIGVGGLMTEISLFLNTAKFNSKSITTAAGIAILAEAMKILASACADFGSMDWGAIVKGLQSIGILLAEMAVFTNVTANAKNVITTGIALVAIGGAMKILASALMDFGSIDWGAMVKGLEGMGIVLTELVVAVNLLPTNLPVTATGLVIVAAAMKIVASALADMGGLDWETLKKGLIGLGGSLGMLAIGLNAMTGTVGGSAALLVAAGALAILAPSLSLLGAMTWESIVKGLVDLAAVIVIFGASAALLTPIIPSMYALSGALVLLGISMLGIGGGLALVGVGLAGIATGFTLLAGVTAAGATALVASLGIIITGVAALIPAIMQKIGEGIVAFIQVFTNSIPQILQCITTIITAIIQCIVTNIPAIVGGILQTLKGILDAVIQWGPGLLDDVGKILTMVLDAILKWMPTIVKQITDILIAMLKAITDNMAAFVKAGSDLIVSFLQGVANNLQNIIDAALKVITSFINGLADGIRNNAGPISDACENLIKAVVDALGTFTSKMVDAGIYAVEGFVKGIGDSISRVWNAGTELGRSALNAAREAIDSHSPSKEFQKLGNFSGQGFVIGLNDYNSKVADAGYNMGSGALTSMSKAISGISDIVNDNIDSQPVITPVMDLSQIQNGSNQLYGMMNNLGDYGIDGSVSMVNSTAKSISSRQLLGNTTDVSTSKTGTLDSKTVTKQPVALQLVLQNGRAIAEYLVDDIDSLMGNKNIIVGRSVGQ